MRPKVALFPWTPHPSKLADGHDQNVAELGMMALSFILDTGKQPMVQSLGYICNDNTVVHYDMLHE